MALSCILHPRVITILNSFSFLRLCVIFGLLLKLTHIHIMPRGGKREGSGPKPTWKSGKTKTIRVPEVLADQVLDLARRLDDPQFAKSFWLLQVIDLSSINIPTIRGKSFVFLEDLMKIGYEIKPLEIANTVRQQSLKPLTGKSFEFSRLKREK